MVSCAGGKVGGAREEGKTTDLVPVPGQLETADSELGELAERRGGEVEVESSAARAAVSDRNGDGLALVYTRHELDGHSGVDVMVLTVRGEVLAANTPAHKALAAVQGQASEELEEAYGVLWYRLELTATTSWLLLFVQPQAPRPG